MSMGTGPHPVQLRDCPKSEGGRTNAKYYILLKATCESGLPAWLPYRLTATSAELAVEKAKKMAEDHYREYKTFEVQVIENEGSYK